MDSWGQRMAVVTIFVLIGNKIIFFVNIRRFLKVLCHDILGTVKDITKRTTDLGLRDQRICTTIFVTIRKETYFVVNLRHFLWYFPLNEKLNVLYEKFFVQYVYIKSFKANRELRLIKNCK